MRTYGRVNGAWQVVETDARGYNDLVYATTLIQCVLLNLNESPFYADYGIPAKNSVIQQIAPDFYIALLQQRFSQFFASLVVVRENANPPTYRINITTQEGFKLNDVVAVPY